MDNILIANLKRAGLLLTFVAIFLMPQTFAKENEPKVTIAYYMGSEPNGDKVKFLFQDDDFNQLYFHVISKEAGAKFDLNAAELFGEKFEITWESAKNTTADGKTENKIIDLKHLKQ